MTDLEFINQNICDTKNYIKHLEIKIIEDKKYPSFVKDHQERIEELKPILKHLEQIKAKLEAWEVVEDNTIITEHRCVVDRIEMYNGGKGYEIFKKALEVTNNE